MNVTEKTAISNRAMAALQQDWHRPVIIETDISHALGLIGAVQLALRHPAARQSLSLQQTEKFIIDLIEKIDPEHGDVWRFFNFGFNSEHDE